MKAYAWAAVGVPGLGEPAEQRTRQADQMARQAGPRDVSHGCERGGDCASGQKRDGAIFKALRTVQQAMSPVPDGDPPHSAPGKGRALQLGERLMARDERTDSRRIAGDLVDRQRNKVRVCRQQVEIRCRQVGRCVEQDPPPISGCTCA